MRRLDASLAGGSRESLRLKEREGSRAEEQRKGRAPADPTEAGIGVLPAQTTGGVGRSCLEFRSCRVATREKVKAGESVRGSWMVSASSFYGFSCSTQFDKRFLSLLHPNY